MMSGDSVMQSTLLPFHCISNTFCLIRPEVQFPRIHCPDLSSREVKRPGNQDDGVPPIPTPKKPDTASITCMTSAASI